MSTIFQKSTSFSRSPSFLPIPVLKEQATRPHLPLVGLNERNPRTNLPLVGLDEKNARTNLSSATAGTSGMGKSGSTITSSKLKPLKSIDEIFNVLIKAPGYDYGVSPKGKAVQFTKIKSLQQDNESKRDWSLDPRKQEARNAIGARSVALSFADGGNTLLIKDELGASVKTKLPLTIRIDKKGLTQAYVGEKTLKSFVENSKVLNPPYRFVP
jgi:hypothetical protein